MGAAAEQRTKKLIQEQLLSEQNELITVRRSYVSRLENDVALWEKSLKSAEQDLSVAEKRIQRLRHEVAVLKEERKAMLQVVQDAKKKQTSV